MNKSELAGVMAAHGDNQRKLAEAIGISRVTLNKKINERGGVAFNQAEILAIKRHYDLSDRQIGSIFFAT